MPVVICRLIAATLNKSLKRPDPGVRATLGILVSWKGNASRKNVEERDVEE